MVEKIIENWRKAQKAGAWLPCPRCGCLTMKESLTTNAFSRRADVYICDSCGMEEAIEDMPYGRSAEKKFDHLPLEAWFVTKSVYRQPGVLRRDNGFEVTATQTIFLEVQDVDDIMVCALEGGINYWADAADVVEEKRVADWGHEQIARGGLLMIHDMEENKKYELNLEKFLAGFKLWFENSYDTYGAVNAGVVDCCMIDAGDADQIIQYALFGDLIYG